MHTVAVEPVGCVAVSKKPGTATGGILRAVM